MNIQEELRGLEKWINSNGKKVSAPPANYVPWFQKYAAQYSWMDSRFLMGMCWIESLFNPKAISPAGAKGLSQFMPGTAKMYNLTDPFDPEDSIRAQAQYLNDMYKKLSFVNSEFDKLMIISVSYNAGEGGRIPMILKREAKNGKRVKDVYLSYNFSTSENAIYGPSVLCAYANFCGGNVNFSNSESGSTYYPAQYGSLSRPYPWEKDLDIMTDRKGAMYSLDNLSTGICRFTIVTNGYGRLGFTGMGLPLYDNSPLPPQSSYNLKDFFPGGTPSKSESLAASSEFILATGHRIRMHKKLEAPLKAAFEEIKNLGDFRVTCVGGWDYRNVNNGSGVKQLSNHSFGVAIDINPGSAGNPFFNTHNLPQSDEMIPQTGPWPWQYKTTKSGKAISVYNGVYSRKNCIWCWRHPVVCIMAKHGFGWGGYYGDTMHFSAIGGK